eukprot:TRINITY_DN13746_c0_g2_i1.p1 TRINITY_DN13746_c0_g2~~TRINITY_DN13746_c0_g2_i1.p1  ORF type:complete len:210 (+),score=57.83 TRINITY_DN13746_c0_g2_i1:63-692(+)
MLLYQRLSALAVIAAVSPLGGVAEAHDNILADTALAAQQSKPFATEVNADEVESASFLGRKSTGIDDARYARAYLGSYTNETNILSSRITVNDDNVNGNSSSRNATIAPNITEHIKKDPRSVNSMKSIQSELLTAALAKEKAILQMSEDIKALRLEVESLASRLKQPAVPQALQTTADDVEEVVEKVSSQDGRGDEEEETYAPRPFFYP